MVNNTRYRIQHVHEDILAAIREDLKYFESYFLNSFKTATGMCQPKC